MVDVLLLAEGIGKAKIDEFNFFVANMLEYFRWRH